MQNTTILLTILFLLSACAPAMVAPIAVKVPVAPGPVSPALKTAPTITSTDPEKNLQAALDAYKAGNGDAALAIARSVSLNYPHTPWYKRSLFLMEQTLIQMDLPAEADASMLRVQYEYPELADYAVLLLADYHYAKARYSQAGALYQQLIVRYPKSSLTMRAAFRRGQALMESYAYVQAAEALDQFLQDYPRSDLAPAAGISLGRALTAEADLGRSVQVYRDVWVKYPGDPNDQAVENALTELKGGGVDVPDTASAELYERGKNLSRLGQHEKAIEAFTRLLDKEPKTPIRPDVLFRIGFANHSIGKRSEAAVVLERMVKEYPSDQRTPDALYWLGKSYSKLGEWEKGVKTFQKILDRFPESEWADDALFLTGNIYREAGDMKKALSYYSRLVAEYPESKFADSGIWWRGWSLYLANDLKKAEQTMQELVNRYPRSFLVNQCRYWQGRIAEKRGDPARAGTYYDRVLKRGPYTYYGSRAAERRAALVPDGVVTQETTSESIVLCGGEGALCPDDPLMDFDTDDGPPIWTEETKRLLAQEPSFRKTLELMHLDMKKEAAAELWFLQDRAPRKRGALIGLSKAFFELGDYNRSLLLVLRNYERYLEAPQTEAPEDLWRLAYPQGYWGSIQASARKYGQDPYFVAAIIREESQFHPAALSPAGARGLMQVMPSTGEWAAQIMKLPGFDGGRLFESDTAIQIGTWYVSHLMKRFKGDPLLVAAAYNAGPDAVTGWISRNGFNKDRDAFVEAIPFMETRGYVKKVLRNYAEYKRIYGKTSEFVDIGLQIEQ